MKITPALLNSLNACREQTDLFTATFPDGLDVSGEPDTDTIARIAEAKLDVAWLCSRVLIAPAYAEYERVRAPAYAEYERVRAAAMDEYARVTAPAYAEYERVRAPAYAEYERVRAHLAWKILADGKNLRSTP